MIGMIILMNAYGLQLTMDKRQQQKLTEGLSGWLSGVGRMALKVSLNWKSIKRSKCNKIGQAG